MSSSIFKAEPITLPETNILLMAEIRLVVFPIIYRVSYIPGGAGFQPSTVAPENGWLEY